MQAHISVVTGNKQVFSEISELLDMLMGRLDTMISADGSGLRQVLSEIYKKRQQSTITTAEFQKLLEEYSGLDLGDAFNKLVYNRSTAALAQAAASAAVEIAPEQLPLTHEDYISLR